ncbi:MAG: hypothetical protein Q7N87_04715 [Candidatus Uhrbacteria bacterium]|nr:hypothetical protein [Candidatus Uhrbacteria bacterium]
MALRARTQKDRLQVDLSGITRNELALRAAVEAMQRIFDIAEDRSFRFTAYDPAALKDLGQALTTFFAEPITLIPCSIIAQELPIVGMDDDRFGLMSLIKQSLTFDEALRQRIPPETDLQDFGNVRVPLTRYLLTPLQQFLYPSLKKRLWWRWSTFMDRIGQPQKEIVLEGVKQLAMNLIYAACEGDGNRVTIEQLKNLIQSFTRYPILGQGPRSDHGTTSWIILTA